MTSRRHPSKRPTANTYYTKPYLNWSTFPRHLVRSLCSGCGTYCSRFWRRILYMTTIVLVLGMMDCIILSTRLVFDILSVSCPISNTLCVGNRITEQLCNFFQGLAFRFRVDREERKGSKSIASNKYGIILPW